MLAVLGGLADVERDLIRTRTAEGRSRAKERGQPMGRPPSLTTDTEERGHQTPRTGRYVAGIGGQLRPQHINHAPRHPRRVSSGPSRKLRQTHYVIVHGQQKNFRSIPHAHAGNKMAVTDHRHSSHLPIIKALEKLHYNFYPVPCEIRYDLNNRPWALIDQRDVAPLPVLDKRSLLSLYYECGSFLHRGDLDFVLPATIRTVKFDTIQDCLTKIINLVQSHRMKLADSRELS